MIGVLTADPDALLEAMDLLEDTGDRRLGATLLYYGGTVGGDAEVLEFAVEEARASGDLFLLLEVLHATGGRRAQHEARRIVTTIEATLPDSFRIFFQQHLLLEKSLSSYHCTFQVCAFDYVVYAFHETS